MPRMAPVPCYLCGRSRNFSKLEPQHIPDLGDGTEEAHYRLCCIGVCHPTWWEARREARQERKARDELARWVTQPQRRNQ